ncbi:MAG: AAA family ATPase [Terracidiphilus sp.]|nr:AAA family ATPase [Terracidiphilus sp.]MDR3798557.1 AAA family ATPase [Terracidiphilus sp.]
MIRRIQIDNFKSLVGFSLPPAPNVLGKFTCLIGANGSGKTTVLQTIDFLSQLVKGRVPEWLRERNWSSQELLSQLEVASGECITITTEIQLASTLPLTWKCTFSCVDSSVLEESIWENNQCLLLAKDGWVSFTLSDREKQLKNSGLRFSGSALSILADEDLHPSLCLLKRSFSGYVANFELVSTINLKQDSYPSREIGPRGENLPGFLHEISDGIRQRVYTVMREFFPNVGGLQREIKKDDLVRLSIFEKNMRVLLPTGSALSNGISSRHFSDGFTRILAIVAQVESSATPGDVNAPDRILLLDEIENGVHPETMAKLVQYLATAPVQVIATTHSPLILNDLTDAQAGESVIVLYRNSAGRTRSYRYFDLPSAKRKLGILGPGEVYVDTSIEQIAREAEEMERGTSQATGAPAQ